MNYVIKRHYNVFLLPGFVFVEHSVCHEPIFVLISVLKIR